MEVTQVQNHFIESNCSDDSSVSSPLFIDDENINILINNEVNKQYESLSSSAIDLSSLSSRKPVISVETTTKSSNLDKLQEVSVLPPDISIPNEIIPLETVPKLKEDSPRKVHTSKEAFQSTPTHQSTRQSREIYRESTYHREETTPRESILRESRLKPQQQPDVNLRKGKWTIEEENYANEIILLFNKGLLPILPGTTLRSYLSDKLSW
jgi:hypothetical protein